MPSSWDVEIAARTVWGEARGEGDAGMAAVAAAIVNRQRVGKWFSTATLAGCCLYPFQFSSWNLGDPNLEKLLRLPESDPLLGVCREAVLAAIAGNSPDPVMGATHYYSDTISPPNWTASPAVFEVKIGHHLFYRNVA